MSGKRQKTQYSLALNRWIGVKPLSAGCERAEPLVAESAPESPVWTEQLMEKVCDRESSPSVSPNSTSLPKLNPVEPPWYVTRMPGGVGGAAP